MSSTMIFDMSGILYRTFYANQNEDELTSAGMAHHIGLTSVNKFFKENLPVDRIVMVFDRPSWRKKYTASPKCVSKRPYKGNRRQNMTEKQQAKFAAFKEHVLEFETMIREHTSITVLSSPLLEADDLIAGYVRMHPDDQLIVMSADKDMLQLLDHPNIKLIDPFTSKPRNLDDCDGDVEYFLFKKCFRGDAGDNVMSAYPRLRETEIRKAYEDAYHLANLLNHEWSDAERTYKVKDLYAENRLLMDLRCQPSSIQELIQEVIDEELNRKRAFSMFHFLKFTGKYQLKKIAENIQNYIQMLSK